MVKFAAGSEGDVINIPLIDPLFKDLVECERLLDNNDSQFSRRTYMRCSFAYLEANLYCLKGQVLQLMLKSLMPGRPIPTHKIVLLLNESAKIDTTGKIKIDESRHGFRNFMAFVLRTFSELGGFDADKLFDDNGWRELNNSLKVRNRITHPKKHQDLFISDKEISAMRTGHTWYINCTLRILDAMNEAEELNMSKQAE